MQLEKEKELKLERLRQHADLDEALALKKVKQQTERAKLDLEAERLKLTREGKMCDMSCSGEWAQSNDNSLDILSNLHLVPKFNEKEVETFFTLFERVADARGWVDSDRVVLLQCVLTGRAQEALCAL